MPFGVDSASQTIVGNFIVMHSVQQSLRCAMPMAVALLHKGADCFQNLIRWLQKAACSSSLQLPEAACLRKAQRKQLVYKVAADNLQGSLMVTALIFAQHRPPHPKDRWSRKSSQRSLQTAACAYDVPAEGKYYAYQQIPSA